MAAGDEQATSRGSQDAEGQEEEEEDGRGCGEGLNPLNEEDLARPPRRTQVERGTPVFSEPSPHRPPGEPRAAAGLTTDEVETLKAEKVMEIPRARRCTQRQTWAKMLRRGR